MCCLTLCSFRECRSLIFYDITIFVIFFPQLLKKKIIASYNKEYVVIVSFDTRVILRNLQRWVNIFYWFLINFTYNLYQNNRDSMKKWFLKKFKENSNCSTFKTDCPGTYLGQFLQNSGPIVNKCWCRFAHYANLFRIFVFWLPIQFQIVLFAPRNERMVKLEIEKMSPLSLNSNKSCSSWKITSKSRLV